MPELTNGVIILALDASTTNVGWTVGQGERYITGETYHPTGQVEDRIGQIIAWIGNAIETFAPDLVAIEEPAAMMAHMNPKTDRLLNRLCGIIEGIARDRGIDVVLIHPKTVKATGLHKGTRRAVAIYIGQDKVDEDHADAVGVWVSARNKIQERRLRELADQYRGAN